MQTTMWLLGQRAQTPLLKHWRQQGRRIPVFQLILPYCQTCCSPLKTELHIYHVLIDGRNFSDIVDVSTYGVAYIDPNHLLVMIKLRPKRSGINNIRYWLQKIRNEWMFRFFTYWKLHYHNFYLYGSNPCVRVKLNPIDRNIILELHNWSKLFCIVDDCWRLTTNIITFLKWRIEL